MAILPLLFFFFPLFFSFFASIVPMRRVWVMGIAYRALQRNIAYYSGASIHHPSIHPSIHQVLLQIKSVPERLRLSETRIADLAQPFPLFLVVTWMDMYII